MTGKKNTESIVCVKVVLQLDRFFENEESSVNRNNFDILVFCSDHSVPGCQSFGNVVKT